MGVFLFLAAFDHIAMALPGINGWYERSLRQGRNYARWAEYSISASLMVVLIAMLVGITDLYALVGIFAANSAMILFGLLMEQANPPGQAVNWLLLHLWVRHRDRAPGLPSPLRSSSPRAKVLVCLVLFTASSRRCSCSSTALV
ncbi:MAG: heliorhodopsin HeR [Acidimicrobiales bacterium]